jgi:hypothetical protein
MGAGGEEVGQLVAKELGFRYADDEIIATAAERAGVSRETMERAERPPGLIARILETMASVPVEPQMYYGQALTVSATPSSMGYDELLRDVIIETANKGDVVIVAHGAGICLGSRTGLLRVLVTASPELRAARVAANAKLEPKAADKAVRDSDQARQDFLKRFYDVGHELPVHYDLVVNTETFSPQQAASLIASAAKS